MELEGETTVEGRWVDRVVGLNDVRADITMMRTPDGHGRVELTKFHTPPAVRAEPESAPANTLGIRRIMFAGDDIDDGVGRDRKSTRLNSSHANISYAAFCLKKKHRRTKQRGRRLSRT